MTSRVASLTDISIAITGMSCASCAGRLEKQLAKLAEIDTVSVNIATESAHIRLNSAISFHTLSRAIEQVGYGIATDDIHLDVKGMSCASCVGRVEKVLSNLNGVLDVSVNLATESAHVRVAKECISPDTLVSALHEGGYAANVHHEIIEPSNTASPKIDRETSHLVIAGLLSAPMVFAMIFDAVGFELMPPAWLQFLLATPIQFWLGARFYRAAWFAVKAGTGNMDLLVALGTSASYGLSVFQLISEYLSPSANRMGHYYFEASAVVITLVLLGKWLENRAKHQTTAAIRALQALRPATATIRKQQGDIKVAIDQISNGDIVVVKAGEQVPVDGVIVEGSASVDESMISGESLPVQKTIGDKLVGGVINNDALLLIKTTAVGAETTLARIIRLVENAQAAKAPVQRLVDKVSMVFVPVVIAIAISTLVTWYLYNGHLQEAIINAVTVLVIACPCALGLATPAAIMTGTGAAARRGILIKDAQALERAHNINIVAFDKTGTLTVGSPRLLDTIATDDNAKKLLSVAAALQSASDHPLAKAVLQEADLQAIPIPAASEAKTFAGRGVQASVDGKTYILGNTRLMGEAAIPLDQLEDKAKALETQGRTVSWLAETGDTATLIGLLGFGDELKPSAKSAIKRLQNAGIKTVMITGDNEGSARANAAELGIETYFANILPDGKADAIQGLRNENTIVAMVGDGINDAPALAAADVGIAMATGTDVAMHTAGITLMRGDPALVADAIDISRRSYQKIRQNLFWAFIYNLLGIPLAASGLLSPAIAGAAMAFSSLSVVCNALLLRRWEPKP